MIARESPYIASAYEQLQVISQDKEKRLAYDARLKAQLDQNQLVNEAEQRGKAKGKAEIITKMLKKKPIEQVAEELEISVEEVKDILAHN